MSPGVATKVIAGCCALTAFAVGVVAGLIADNPVETILLRALGAMIVGQIVGTIVGAVGERTLAEAMERYKKEHPIPDPKLRTGGESLSTSSNGEPALIA